jgi:hypothetical protein
MNLMASVPLNHTRGAFTASTGTLTGVMGLDFSCCIPYNNPYNNTRNYKRDLFKNNIEMVCVDLLQYKPIEWKVYSGYKLK